MKLSDIAWLARRPKAKPVVEPAPRLRREVPRWRVLIAGENIAADMTVAAHTKSEARGIAKRRLGLRRLPVGAEVRRAG